MIGMGILQPVAALAIWTMIMWWWLYLTRLPAGKDMDQNEVRMKGPSVLDQLLPAKAQWKAHNYNHLHEAPTVFYAVALLLALVGAGDGLAANLGWAYVACRVAHSLVQSLGNWIIPRFVFFALSSFALMGLVFLAAKAVF